MPFCVAPTSHACSTASAPDVGRTLIRLASPLLPGRVTSAVRNQALPGTPPTVVQHHDTPLREARAVLDGISSQMIGWGTAVGFTRLLALAEGVAPGISVPWVAYQAFCALSDAARGDLLRCLQALPFGAILPTQLRTALSPLLQCVVPAGLPDARHHHDVIIAVGSCALLYELTRQQPVEIPRSRVGRALLQRLAQLRAVLNVVGGLHQPDNPADVSSSVQPATRLLSSPAVGAWPLPGAAARSGKGNAAAPARPPAPPRPNPRTRFTIKLLPRRHPGHPGKAAATGAGAAAATGESGGIAGSYSVGNGLGTVGSGNGVGAGDANKEAMFGVLPSKKKDRTAKSADEYNKPADKTGGRPTQPRPTRRVATGPGKAVRATDSTTVPATSPSDDAVLPSCVHFHHVQEAMRQVRKARFDANPLRFCVDDRARPAFETVFDTASEPRAHRRDWMVSLPLRERYAVALRDARIKKYSGLGELHLQARRDSSTLGSDDLYTVVTISVLSGQHLHRHHVADTQVLDPGTFRLIEHAQLDGQVQRVLAYYIERESGSDPGVRAGFLRVEQDATGFVVADEDSALTFSSDSLDALLAGIERVSGWRYRSAGTSPSSPAPCTLFVRQRSSTDAALHFNRRLPFFDTVRIGRNGRLLRMCFVISGGMVTVVDAQGKPRTLVFTRVDGEGDLYSLNAQRPEGRRFIQSLELEAGCAYALQDVAGTLEQNGFIQLTTEVVARSAPSARPAHLHVQRGDAQDWTAVVLEAGESGEIIAPPLFSTFHVTDERIDYVDHDGTAGVLRLRPEALTPGLLQIAASNEPHALSFAAQSGMEQGRGYTMATLAQLLHTHGFVQVSEAEGGHW